ncbi:GTPase IMAP family member 1-like [Elgaria multicarinata webbii]|uniref:GTPase IMAP family member 1-like n=1 Tax=Elgaria multicarinata webbii TaxID=159646 RepID=UPI002FCCB885
MPGTGPGTSSMQSRFSTIELLPLATHRHHANMQLLTGSIPLVWERALDLSKGYLLTRRELLCREIKPLIDLSRPSPHALVSVTQVGCFMKEDEAVVKHVQDVFGTEATKHMIVLFTHKEDWAHLHQDVKKSDNKALLDLIKKCGDHISAFNNRAAGEEQEGQVSLLMETVLRMVHENGGRHYVNELY